MRIVRLYLFLLLNCFTFICNSQNAYNSSDNLKFKHFGTREGLSQSSGISIFQDSHGYLWFGTRDGLNKYDGTKFIKYWHDSEDNSSLTHSWVTSLFEDSLGNLWIGTKGGLNKYIPSSNNFKQFKFSADANEIAKNEIWDIVELENQLYVATGKGIVVIHINDNQDVDFKSINKENSFLNDSRIRGFLKISEQELWIATVSKIHFYNLKKDSSTPYNYPSGTDIEKHISNAPIIYKSSNDVIWLGNELGLSVFDKSNNEFSLFKSSENKLIQSDVRTICEDFEGNIWVGTYTGLYLFNLQEKQLRHIVHNENDFKSLSQNSIYKIIQDSRGDMWIGTWAGGVNFFDRSYDYFKHLAAGVNDTMLNYKVISSIIQDGEELWIGTEGGGINIFNKKTGKFTYYQHNPTNKNSLSSNNVKSMLKDSDGNYWVGTHDGGINFLNPRIKPFKFQYFDTSSNGFDINEFRILSLKEDVNKNIWIGTLTAGLFVYDYSKKTFTKLENVLKSITCIEQSRLDSNTLLIGGTKGFQKVNINTKVISNVISELQTDTSLLNRTVNCIFEDKNNNYWIGTEGSGLYLYNTNTQKAEKFGIKQGLPNEVVYGILADDESNLWISTNNGISKMSLQSNQFINFDESDGLQGNEFNYGAYLKTTNGDLYFGGTNGLNYFNPESIVENTFIPPVDIYAFNVSNHLYLNVTDSITNLKLEYDQNDFSIDFTALSFSQPTKNSYAYKLEGFDPDWNYIGNSKTATYTNLDEGDYNFRVKASNNNGLWNEKGASLIISIQPAPWKTWWAYVLYAIGFAILLYFIRNLVLARIAVRNELKREKLDKERLEEVNRLKLKLFTNISHDFRTPLTLILGPVEQLLKRGIKDDIVNKKLQTVQRNTNILLQLINELLDFRKNESGKLVLYASYNDIIPFIKNIKLSFEELATQRSIAYNFHSEKSSIETWYDKIKIKKILFNLLSNAFKFTKDGGEIDILVNTIKTGKGNFIKLEVVNNGRVIHKDQLQFVFDRFHQLNRKDLLSGTGIGLSLTKSLVELHAGTISVESSLEAGTRFTVVLPLGDAHLSEEQKIIEEVTSEGDDTLINTPAIVQKEMASAELLNAITPQNIDESLSTLLIVEDNTEVRDLLKGIFIDKYNVIEAENGKKALEIANSVTIDLVVSDVMMPIMSGFDMCKAIKTNIITSHIPVILLTAKSSDIHKKQGYKYGADAYVTKPFDASVLELRVKNLLQTRQNFVAKFKKDIILEPKELTVTSADEQFLKKAIEIVENNISDPDFNVHSFTKEMGMSRSVIFRKLKALTGQSITLFLRTLKLKRAGQLLQQTQMNISEVAYEVGFNDLKYFRKCFKEEFNVLPSQYRNKE